MKRKPLHRPGASDAGKPDPQDSKRPRKKQRPRDMSQLQFDAALKRHGLYKQTLWIYSHEYPRKNVEVIYREDGTIDRRATLAKAIKEFKVLSNNQT